jgi:mannose-6-phosphate isomerase-like protein (cupin superfamily)
MRILVTGVDGQGRSCVLEESTPSLQGDESGGITVAPAFATNSSPPPARPPGRGDILPVTVAPGTARWSFVQFPPGTTTALHHTDSLDFDVIIEGRVDIVLDDGPHSLGPGDGVVVNGVDHSWQTHEESCRMSVVVIGTPPLGDR